VKKFALCAAVVVAALAVSAAPAMAQTVVSPSPDGAGSTLSTLLGTLYPTSTLVRVGDGLGGDQMWVSEAGNVTATARYAGFTNTFGFIGGHSGAPLATWDPRFVVTGGMGAIGGPAVQTALPSPSAAFRFGLSTPVGLWSSLNVDNSDGLDHMVTYYISAGTGVGNYVIAFEDLAGPLEGPSDRDFNDLVLTIAGARPTPEPGTLLLFGSAAAGLYAYSRRKRGVKATV